MKEFNLENAPAYAASRRAEAHTDRDRVTLAKNHVLVALGELEKTDAYDDEKTRIPGIVSDLESAEKGLADMLEDYELGNIKEQGQTSGTTWHGLNAEGMAAILDDLWGAGAFDNERWDEWFKMYGSPYRVMPSKHETEQAIHWQVTAIPDDSAERITMAQFHVKSDAQAYAKTLGEDWEPMVTAVNQ